MPMFLALAFLALFMLAGWFFTGIFGTSFTRRLVARRLDTAQGAAEIFNLAFVIKLLLLRQFHEFQDVFHLFERFFKRFHNTAHIIHGPCQGGWGVLFDALALHGWPVSGA